MTNYIYALICVFALSAGQILFKAAAIASNESAGLIALKPLVYLAAAMAIYAGASILWVWLLRSEELGRIYPLMALAFVIVPFASKLIYGEQFQSTYIAGVILIIAGLLLTTRP